jgi:hypothetical protein
MSIVLKINVGHDDVLVNIFSLCFCTSLFV